MSRAGYNIRGHGAMVGDRIRTGAYERALARTVKPGSVVLDIGTGVGIFALEACRLGARRVYAVEPDPAVEIARELARANGMADRIEFIRGLSTEVELPERADVVVSDLRGVLPLATGHVASIADARRRHLAEGGILIPRSDTIWAAPVEAPEAYRALVEPWSSAPGLDLSQGRDAALNDWGKARFEPDQLVGAPQRWAVLDYYTAEQPSVSNTLEWVMERDATVHGFAMWFEADLAEGIGFSTGPLTAETIYGTGFVAGLRPLSVSAGDRLAFGFHARVAREDYVWAWETRAERPNGAPIDRFKQSTLRASLVGTEQLRKQAHRFRPALGARGTLARAVLEMMDGKAAVEEIAAEVMRRFPGRFRRWEEALSRVAQLSEEYGE